jgi:hypothetical protein
MTCLTYTGSAAIPEVSQFRGTRLHRHVVWSFRHSLMDLPYRGSLSEIERRMTRDFHRSSCQPFCKGETIKHQWAAHRVTVRPGGQTRHGRVRRFITLRSLASPTGRNMIPPLLVRLGPFHRLLPPNAGT